jgi:hypothetical protein
MRDLPFDFILGTPTLEKWRAKLDFANKHFSITPGPQAETVCAEWSMWRGQHWRKPIILTVQEDFLIPPHTQIIVSVNKPTAAQLQGFQGRCGLVTPIRSEQVLNNKFATAYVYGEEISKALVANMTAEPIQIRKGTQIAEFHIRDEKQWDFKSSYSDQNNNNNSKEYQNMPETDQRGGAVDAPQRTFADSEAQLSVGNFSTEGDRRGVCVCAKEKERGGTQLSEFSQSNLSEHMQSNLSKSIQSNVSEFSQHPNYLNFHNRNYLNFHNQKYLNFHNQKYLNRSKFRNQSHYPNRKYLNNRVDRVRVWECLESTVCGRILCENRPCAGVGVFTTSCVWGLRT